MPILQNYMIFTMVPDHAPFLIRPLLRVVFNTLKSQIVDPRIKVNLEMVSTFPPPLFDRLITLKTRLSLTSRLAPESSSQVALSPLRPTFSCSSRSRRLLRVGKLTWGNICARLSSLYMLGESLTYHKGGGGLMLVGWCTGTPINGSWRRVGSMRIMRNSVVPFLHIITIQQS